MDHAHGPTSSSNANLRSSLHLLLCEPRTGFLLAALESCLFLHHESAGEDEPRVRTQAEPHEEIPADRAHLRKILGQRVLHKLSRTCIPQAVVDVLVELVQISWQHAQDHHQSDAAIQTPEGGSHEDWAPVLRLDHVLHAEEDAGQWDVSLHAKHGPMSVATGEEGGMLAVANSRRRYS